MQESASIHIGPSSRLYTLDHYHKAFAPFGVSRAGFIALLRALHVPKIRIAGTYFVDHLSFTLALRAITTIGRPDFWFPGHTKDLPAHSTKSLDPAYVQSNLRSLLAPLLDARVPPHSYATQRAFAPAVNAAAARLSSEVFASIPPAVQNQLARSTIARLAPQLLASDPSDPTSPLYTSEPLPPSPS